MATFLLHLCIWSSYSSTHWPDFPWRLHVLRCEETQASRGSRGCLVSSESQQKRACGENHMSMWQLTQLSFFYDRISKSIISVHLLTHECMGEVWRVQEKRNTWLYCVSIIVGAQRHVFQYKTVRKECQQLWFRMSWKGPQYMSYYPNHEWFILIVLWHITLEEFLLVTFVARLWFFVRECDALLNLQRQIGSRN